MEDILTKHAGTKIFIFDHTFSGGARISQTEPCKSTVRGPVVSGGSVGRWSSADAFAFSSSTPIGRLLLRNSVSKCHFSHDAERLLKGRYCIVDVWRSARRPQFLV
ncbi:hypothetical protein J3R83DRAFT_11916 [Lanmaoa asiatica]|nr:hypothetical protein J3R83DRAFT_11916 [Lanmaoa asiatica]